MQFLDYAIEIWSLDYDDFAFIAEQQKPARLDLAVKLLAYRGFGCFFPFSVIDDKIVHWVADPPSGSDVLFWSQGQRDAGFRMLDRVPFISEKRTIKAGQIARDFEVGKPINFSFDINTYFEHQRHSSLIIVHNGKIRYEQYGLDFHWDHIDHVSNKRIVENRRRAFTRWNPGDATKCKLFMQ